MCVYEFGVNAEIFVSYNLYKFVRQILGSFDWESFEGVSHNINKLWPNVDECVVNWW